MPSSLFTTASSVAFIVAVTLLAVLIPPKAVHATSLTYKVVAHERACFYTWADVPKKKIAFYFAVRTPFATPYRDSTQSPRAFSRLALCST